METPRLCILAIVKRLQFKRSGHGRDPLSGRGLTYRHTYGMVFHMKTTLNITDTVMRALKSEAARQGKTMAELVETALRALLEQKPERAEIPPLPEFSSGGARVNVANRDMLYNVMER